MTTKIPAFFFLAAFIALFFTYGGFQTPFLTHILVSIGALLAVLPLLSTKNNARAWQEERMRWIPVLGLFVFALFQLWISPNKGRTVEAFLWLASALLVWSTFSRPSATNLGPKNVTRLWVLAGLFEAVWIFLSLTRTDEHGGNLVNPNHAAAFFMFPFWLALKGESLNSRMIRFGVLTLTTFGLFLTFSVGGLLAVGLSLLLYSQRHRLSPLFSIPIALALLVTVQVVHAFRFAPLSHPSNEMIPLKFQDADRLAMIRATVRMILEHPWMGQGVGGFAERYPFSTDIETTDRVAHFAHHDILQLFAELGIPLALLCTVLLFFLFRYLVRLPKASGHDRWREAVGWIGITLTFHSLVDFPWHVPILSLGFVCLVAVACASELPRRALPTSAVATLSVMVAIVAITGGIGTWCVQRSRCLSTASLLMPWNPEPARQLGRQALENKRPREALAYAKRAVRRAPLNADHRELLAAALILQGKPEEATAEIEHAVQLDPHNGKRLERASKWLIENGNEKAAVGVAAKLRELDPHWTVPCFHLMRQVASVPSLLYQCIGSKNPRALFDLSVFLEKEGEFLLAYDVAYSNLPNILNKNNYRSVADFAIHAQRIEEGLATISSQPNAPKLPTHLLAGRLNMEQDAFDSALIHLEKAAQISGDLGHVWDDYSKTLQRVSPVDHCTEAARRIRSRWSSSPYSFLAEAICAERSGEVSRAISETRQAIKMAPSIEASWHMSIRLWKQKGMPQRGTDLACEALDFHTGHTIFLRTCIGELAQSGRCAEMRTQWQKRMNTWPNPDDWQRISQMLQKEEPAISRCSK